MKIIIKAWSKVHNRLQKNIQKIARKIARNNTEDIEKKSIAALRVLALDRQADSRARICTAAIICSFWTFFLKNRTTFFYRDPIVHFDYFHAHSKLEKMENLKSWKVEKLESSKDGNLKIRKFWKLKNWNVEELKIWRVEKLKNWKSKGWKDQKFKSCNV